LPPPPFGGRKTFGFSTVPFSSPTASLENGSLAFFGEKGDKKKDLKLTPDGYCVVADWGEQYSLSEDVVWC